jgi:hypothetical protein
MRRLRPAPDFAAVGLTLATIQAGRTFGRIYLDRYSNPQAYGKSRSRFSDPRRRDQARLGSAATLSCSKP